MTEESLAQPMDLSSAKVEFLSIGVTKESVRDHQLKLYQNSARRGLSRLNK